MEQYLWYAVGFLIVVAVIDCYNGWKLGSKISGKDADDINNEIKNGFLNLNETIEGWKTTIDDLKTNIENMKKLIDEKVQDFIEIKEKVEDIINTIKDFKDQIDEIKNNLKLNKENEEKVKASEQKIIELQTQIDDMKAKNNLQ